MGAENVLIELIYISSKVYLVFYLKKMEMRWALGALRFQK